MHPAHPSAGDEQEQKDGGDSMREQARYPRFAWTNTGPDERIVGSRVWHRPGLHSCLPSPRLERFDLIARQSPHPADRSAQRLERLRMARIGRQPRHERAFLAFAQSASIAYYPCRRLEMDRVFSSRERLELA